MTENQLERRYIILVDLIEDKREDYIIKLDGSFISIRNKKTADGTYTDSLQLAKRWIKKDMKRKI